MRIALIQPATNHVIATELPGHVSKEVGSFPPLGLLYLAGYLRDQTAHEPLVLDMVARNWDDARLAQWLRQQRPDAVGITAITHNLVGVQAAARVARRVLPGVPVILGGPHVNAFGADSLALPEFDYALAGEGERPLAALLDSLAGRGDMDDIAGLLRRDGERIVGATPAWHEQDLDSLPLPARDLVRADDYFYVLGKRATFATVIASRGCPFKCTFCSTPRGGYRMRSPDNVVDEMEACLAAGAEEIHFVDDTFNLGRKRLADISQAILDRGLQARWSFRGRADGMSEHGVRLAARAGCVRFHVGIETGTDLGLQELKKGVDVGQIRRAVELAKRYGIVCAAYFMIGLPHEHSAADVRRTIDFAVALDPDFAMFNILAIYPNTEIFDVAVERGLLEPDFWTRFVREPRADFTIPFWDEHLTRDELQTLLTTAYRRFYLRPALVWRNLKSLGSLSELRRKAEAGLSILLGRS